MTAHGENQGGTNAVSSAYALEWIHCSTFVMTRQPSVDEMTSAAKETYL